MAAASVERDMAVAHRATLPVRHGITVVLIGTWIALAVIRFGMPRSRSASPPDQSAAVALNQNTDDPAWTSAVAEAAKNVSTIEQVVAAALPDATPEVRNIWIESFRGRTVQEAREILAIRARMEVVTKTTSDKADSNDPVPRNPADPLLPNAN